MARHIRRKHSKDNVDIVANMGTKLLIVMKDKQIYRTKENWTR